MVQLPTALVTLTLTAGLDPSIPVLLTLQGFLFAHVLYVFVYAMNYCIMGFLSTCGFCTILVLTVIAGSLLVTILGSAG